uniref:Arrestin domain-containing protein 3-like n=1 Tax=Stegastes partitus TaxID=144197 RepID=A0A3B4ZCS0_9TELE
MPTIKSFSVGLSPDSNSLTNGVVMGQITLELSKECKIVSLYIKLKGKAEVKWSEKHGKRTVTYHSKDKYFSVKQSFIQENQGNNVVDQGLHVYPFSFQIPADLPSSFRGRFGWITYMLQANLSRSMRIDDKATAVLNVVYRGNPDPVLMIQQQGNIDKKMNLFNSGKVGMDVNIEKTGFHQGEGIKVVASIQNRSSREIKPKYHLYRKCSYFAKGKRKLEKEDILREVGEAVPPSAGQTVTRIITISPITPVSILNCKIIKVEYRLRVYLDVKYASDPEIKFPIVILPAPGGDIF